MTLLDDTPLATVRMLVRYKAWADGITYSTVLSLPNGEALRPRQTRFGNMVHTLNHDYVVDDIFKAHLESRRHAYAARNTDHPPPLEELWRAVQAMDTWYVEYADALTTRQLREVIRFEFVGGGEGAMTREQVLLHVVNHGTYQVPAASPANDLTVFLRDAYAAA